LWRVNGKGVLNTSADKKETLSFYQQNRNNFEKRKRGHNKVYTPIVSKS
jgi:hypothetical protein